MKNRGTYALIALFFGGLVALWAAEIARMPGRASRDRARNRVLVDLIDTKPDAVARIEIEGGAAPIVFERREGNRWQMTSPLDVTADPSKVENLAFNLKELTRKPEADTLSGDPASFGLAPPSRTVKFWGSATDAPLATLEIGKLSLDRRYVRAGGSGGVEVVEARMVELAELPAPRWRDREVFRVPSFEVDAVSVAGPGLDLKFRRGPDTWRIVAPCRLLASESKVEGLIADLGSLRVADDSRFVADGVKDADLARYGLKDPRLTIEVDAGRGDRRRPPQVLHVGKTVEGKPGQVYVRKGDQDDVIAVDSRVLDRIGPGWNEFRSPKVVDMKPGKVARFRVRTNQQEYDLVRSGADWYVVRPSPARADRKSVEEFLKGVGEIQTSDYLAIEDAPESGLDEPEAIDLAIWNDPDPKFEGPPNPDPPPAASLRIGRRDAARKTIYARIEGDRTILALPDSARNAVPRSPLAFRDRSVIAVPADQIRGLAFDGLGKKVALRPSVLKLDARKDASEGWWMVAPVASPADADSVRRLLAFLGDLKADGFAAEPANDLAPFGLIDPPLKVTWTLRSEAGPTPALRKGGPGDSSANEEQSLLVGSSVPDRPGSRYAMIAGRPLVFVLGAASIATLDAEWHRHRVLGFDPGSARRLRLTWPGREFLLSAIPHPSGSDWQVEGAVDAPGFDASETTGLVRSLSTLATSRFVQYDGDFPPRAGLAVPRLSLLVEFADGAAPKLLRVGNYAGASLAYATTEAGPRGAVFTLPEALLARWIKEPRRRGELPDDVFAPDRP